ncbi:MAG TPA: hydantoinase B/oxoprolinase family protein [Solirubrobacteraceae bacterium]|jgi:N-methylhydantoinase B|nr:hydantoinase B/oxoprolinase family protein [Solirubrobacteraceae bacterium]
MSMREGFWDGVAHSYIPSGELALPGHLALHTERAAEVDPITYEVVRYALLQTNLEHSALLQRLCVSPIIILTRDFQTSLLTETGELIFLGPNLQYFSNSHSLAIQWALEHRVGDLGLGAEDMFIANDVFVGAPHQPDTCLAAPVFVEGKLFSWVANSLHFADVGGSTMGSFCIDAEDTWQEPLNWPPVKIVENGRLRIDIEDLFVRQSRLPGAVRMDLRAAVSACEVTRRRVLGLVERYGADVVKAVMLGTLEAGETLLRERLRTLPDGRFSHRGFAECAVPGDRGVYAYQINVTKQGERLIVDNEGTDPQAGSINTTFAAFSGAVLASLTQQMTSELAGAYGGAYRCVEFRPTAGLLNCADFPAAVSPSGALTTELQLNIAVCALAKMLACGPPETRELILGPCLGHFNGTIQGGADPQGNLFIFPNTNGMMGALGGMPERDGVDVGGHFWIPDGIANNTEDVESQYPLLVLYRRLLDVGADGAGRHRGGLGFAEATMPRGALAYQMVLYANESFPKSKGHLGANPGSRASFRLVSGSDVAAQLAAGHMPQSLAELLGEERPHGSKDPALLLGPDDVWEWTSPSAGGYGDPLRREPAAVLADVDAQLMGVEEADRVYGVVVREGAVDVRATTERRRALRAERLGREPGEEVAAPAGALRIGELLHVVDGRWWCNGADLGPVSANYKDAAETREAPVRLLAPEFAAADHELADRILWREYLCPVTGYRIDTELSRAGEPPLHDIALEG